MRVFCKKWAKYLFLSKKSSNFAAKIEKYDVQLSNHRRWSGRLYRRGKSHQSRDVGGSL